MILILMVYIFFSSFVLLECNSNVDDLARDFNATSLSTYDFSTLYTTLPHNLIKDKLIDLIESTFQREGSPYLAFFTSEK